MDNRTYVDGASAWRPEDFETDEMWSSTITSVQIEALRRFALGGAVEDLERSVKATIERWRRVLTEGPGFLRVRGFPTEGLSPDEVERAYLGLGSMLGSPMGQDRKGGLITNIRDEGRPLGAGVRRYQTNVSQDFHTDASDVVGLLCLVPAKTGGESRIVSAHTIYNEMLRRAPGLLEVMYRPMPWSRHAEHVPEQEPYFELAPMADVDGLPRISAIPWFIRQSQAHASAPRLSSQQLEALNLFEEIMRSPSLQITMMFRPGDLQILNNTLVMHARDSYTDHVEPDRRRHLLRLWLGLEQRLTNDVLLSGGFEGAGHGRERRSSA